MIAATATIANPARHLADLTGLEFVVVGPQDDGSPQHTRRVVHLAAPTGGEMGIARTLAGRADATGRKRGVHYLRGFP